ncbi:retrovirus-related pol polyprotein from transposon TNT 1-94 [Tanacetum coccineum]
MEKHGKDKVKTKPNQEEGTDYDETFALVARIEAIGIFLTFSTYMNFKVFQMDVKSFFLNVNLKEEVYVKQPPGFESGEFPNYVCKLDKALYGLKQAPRAWYETLSTFLIQKKFVRGRIDNTLYIFKTKGEVLLVQVLQIKQDDKEISIFQEKYTRDLLKKYEISDSSSVKTPMLPPNTLGPNLSGKPFNETIYQANPKDSHLIAVKRISRYLKETASLGLCTGLKYNNGNYVVHPSTKEVKAELAKIANHEALVQKTSLLKASFPVAWRILMTFFIQVLDGNHSSTKQLNSSQHLIVFSLLTRTKIDIGEIIFSDLVTRLMAKSRQNYVSYPKFISCALERLLGSNYSQDQIVTPPKWVTAEMISGSVTS